MTSKPPRLHLGLSREVLVVMALTFVGAVVRLWAPGRLGLTHFDEGIYALAGLWCFSPRGLAGIDPTVISYAPPGFPILVGWSYVVLGVNDLAAIVVSACAGTLTIPLSAWLARRNFGPGAGGAAAAFAALAGPHIAFSRMALTDASFLLFWLAAIGLGQRFLDRPNLARATVLGGAVGLAQLFKYNGWIAGAIVALSALVWTALHRADRRSRSMAATWGWGLLAAVVAAVVYWPWFAFVDSHGGYAALLAHQRSYLGVFSSWPDHLLLQLAQSDFLSGGPIWLACTAVVAVLGMSISRGDVTLRAGHVPRLLLLSAGLAALRLLPGFSWWVAVIVIFAGILRKGDLETKSGYLLCVAWSVLSVLTPFYHPYARLWLPIEAIGWLMMAGAVVGVRSSVEVAGRGTRWTWSKKSDPLPWFALCCFFFAAITSGFQHKKPHMSLLSPSDSLREASGAVLSGLPKDMKELRVYARPPVLFYLTIAGDIPLRRQPDLAHLLEPRNPNSWALLDQALIRQENIPKNEMDRRLAGWEVFREIPTMLNAPTLLDIDPAAARAEVIDARAPICLLRPVRMEDVR
jgi:dolichyl-phosphate-mannose-protein mannosyltransferase